VRPLGKSIAQQRGWLLRRMGGSTYMLLFKRSPPPACLACTHTLPLDLVCCLQLRASLRLHTAQGALDTPQRRPRVVGLPMHAPRRALQRARAPGVATARSQNKL
jgi:hypothetical protein